MQVLQKWSLVYTSPNLENDKWVRPWIMIECTYLLTILLTGKDENKYEHSQIGISPNWIDWCVSFWQGDIYPLWADEILS